MIDIDCVLTTVSYSQIGYFKKSNETEKETAENNL